MTITFLNGGPQRMILEKSSDNGETWTVLQYFAQGSDCQQVFNMPITTDVTFLSSSTDVICTNNYKRTGSGLERNVEFEIAERLEWSGLPFESNTALQEFLDVTDLRLRLLMPLTNGEEINIPATTAHHFGYGRFYYAISNVDVFVT